MQKKFSYPLTVADLPQAEQHYRLRAEEADCRYPSQREEAEDWTADLPDVVVGGKIDLADIVIEQIALRLDDYPRRPGEVFVFESEFDDGTEDKHNPFDVLAKLKK